MVTCYLGIGSNVGDRIKNIKLAVSKIRRLEHTTVVKLSRIIETIPQGGPRGQQKFLNAVLKIRTNLAPLKLLKKLKSIESELGRTTPAVRNGPRTLDLDILFYADKFVMTKQLVIPHPRMFKRQFVLTPLMDIIK